MEEDINFFAETNFRNQRRRFGIKTNDRRKHFYIIGKTGMGKTVLEANMAIQDIQADRGVAVIDPHGEFAERMLDFVPSRRVNDVIYVNPADLDWPIAFNVMEQVSTEYRHLVASGLMGVFKKIWPDVWSARMEYILNNSILALLEYPGATLLGINRLLADKDYRKKVIGRLTDPVIKAFWTMEFARYNERFQSEAIAPIQNKVGQFISNPLIRNIVGQVKSTIDMRKIMDEGKILIVNLSKGKVGEDNSNLFGAMLITKLQLAAMERVNVPEAERRDFYLYVDEFQNFATESFAGILSEARKYRLCLTLAHQYIGQLVTDASTKVRDAIFGNVGTIAVFRVGAVDAEFLEKEFSPEFTAEDLVNLGFTNTYLKLMIDGVASRPFSATTLPPIPKPEKSYREKIINLSRERYAVSRKIVEEKITRWSQPEEKPEAVKEGEATRAPREEFVPPRAMPRQLFEAVCWQCQKPTQVIFEPDGKRPVYCKDCLVKVRAGEMKPVHPRTHIMGEGVKPLERKEKPIEEQRRPAPTRISLKEAFEKEPVTFSRKSASFPKRPRKEVDIEGLRNILESSLKNIENPEAGSKSGNDEEQGQEEEEERGDRGGILKPGEHVKF